MAKNGFRILDSDMHLMEPPDLWQRYTEPRYRDQAPRGLQQWVRDLRMVDADGRAWGRPVDPNPGQPTTPGSKKAR